ncbi:MAG: 2Fe-2S iron-sulfur cluster binding domain-containing protein [Proteobacteria bacterium]|nr:2Fe-2S iron-sulfur cluster binding domain-containing protein [Pseudomonadota bacterium]
MPQITFIDADGSRRQFEAMIGDTLLEVGQENGIDLEGACEGCMACSTCHVIVDEEWYPRLEPSSEQEKDLLDLVFNLERTSRLGCQIYITGELDGLVVSLPREHLNLQDG